MVKLTFNFAVGIIAFCEKLWEGKRYVIAKQVLKSVTSIGANTREARNAESKVDFVHQFKIAAKDADETDYGLQWCKASEGYPDPGKLLENVPAICRVILKNISLSKKIVSYDPNPFHSQILKSPNFQIV